jgi:hypothetical protein
VMALRFFCVSRAAFPPYFIDEALTHEVRHGCRWFSSLRRSTRGSVGHP